MKKVFKYHKKMANSLSSEPALAFFVVTAVVFLNVFISHFFSDNSFIMYWSFVTAKALIFLVAFPVLIIAAIEKYF